MNFKPLPTDFREHLAELTGNELKVWLAYYLRTGDQGQTSYPNNDTLGKDAGTCLDTVKTCKKSLRAKGWLAYTDESKQSRQGNGRFDVHVMEVRLPWCTTWSASLEEFALVCKLMEASAEENTSHGSAVVESTVVEKIHPEGSRFNCLSFSSSSPKSECGCLSAKAKAAAASQPVFHKSQNENENLNRKPSNLEPTATPTPVPCRDEEVMAKEATPKFHPRLRCKDGTPAPADIDTWSNPKRLEFLEHGRLLPAKETNASGDHFMERYCDALCQIEDCVKGTSHSNRAYCWRHSSLEYIRSLTREELSAWEANTTRARDLLAMLSESIDAL